MALIIKLEQLTLKHNMKINWRLVCQILYWNTTIKAQYDKRWRQTADWTSVNRCNHSWVPSTYCFRCFVHSGRSIMGWGLCIRKGNMCDVGFCSGDIISGWRRHFQSRSASAFSNMQKSYICDIARKYDVKSRFKFCVSVSFNSKLQWPVCY